MSKKNLNSNKAIEKLKELAEKIDFTLFATNLSVPPFHTIPMSTKKVDEVGNIWFLSGKDSKHNENISKDNRVYLTYINKNSMEFLTIYGKAEIVTNKSLFEDLYGKTDDIWFDGVDDPNLCALKIKPEESYYWDTKSNQFVSLIKMGISTITGKEPDLMQIGKLSV